MAYSHVGSPRAVLFPDLVLISYYAIFRSNSQGHEEYTQNCSKLTQIKQNKVSPCRGGKPLSKIKLSSLVPPPRYSQHLPPFIGFPCSPYEAHLKESRKNIQVVPPVLIGGNHIWEF